MTSSSTARFGARRVIACLRARLGTRLPSRDRQGAVARYLGMLALVAQLWGVPPQTPVLSTPIPRVEIVVFSDFQCPFCGQFAQPISQLIAEGVPGVPTSVKFKNFPLTFHANAQLAAQAALAAGEQGKFWDMHDLIFANQAALQRDDLLRDAQKLGLDMDRFRKDLDSGRLKQEIAREQAEGAKLGVTGTPTFFLNGKEYVGARSFDQLKDLVLGDQRRKWALTEITDNLMSRGPAGAPVTLEFFADLESPVSRPAISVVDELLRRYPSAVRLQFRNFPLAFHPQAPLAHEAAMAAARQGRFWEFATYILDHQDALREQDLIAYAGRLGLDETKFAETIRQRRYTARVDADVAEGFKRGLRGSPVIFVNTKRIDGVPSLQTLTEYVEAELAAKK
jgi:protein-disulfide isomerase